jgi:hypothetical protein
VGLPGQSVPEAVTAGPLPSLNILPVMQDDALPFQLGDGGMDPGAGALQV